MMRFVQSEVRRQGILLPEYLDDYVAEDNPVRVIDVFVDELDLGALGFEQPVSLIFETRVAIPPHRTTLLTPILNRCAASRQLTPALTAATTRVRRSSE